MMMCEKKSARYKNGGGEAHANAIVPTMRLHAPTYLELIPWMLSALLDGLKRNDFFGVCGKFLPQMRNCK
jgi:hypothetical protein